MTAGAFPAKLARKMTEEEGAMLDIPGIAAGLVSSDKELSAEQLNHIGYGISADET
jgi:hypothetical protein